MATGDEDTLRQSGHPAVDAFAFLQHAWLATTVFGAVLTAHPDVFHILLQGLLADGTSHLRGINTLIKEANSRQE